MVIGQPTGHCGICGAEVRGEEVRGEVPICQECERSFQSPQTDGPARDESILDLNQYNYRMFPWEPMTNQPALITSKWIWVILALGLVALVVLLSLLRTPLPSCWEISS